MSYNDVLDKFGCDKEKAEDLFKRFACVILDTKPGEDLASAAQRFYSKNKEARDILIKASAAQNEPISRITFLERLIDKHLKDWGKKGGVVSRDEKYKIIYPSVDTLDNNLPYLLITTGSLRDK